MFEWLWNILAWIGWGSKTGKVIILGWENAGKTTLMHLVQTGQIRQFQQTLRPTHEEAKIGNVKVHMTDLGGHEQGREVWQDYLGTATGIMYIVDASDPTYFQESLNYLKGNLLMHLDPTIPVAVIGNKIDQQNACTEQQFRDALQMPPHMTTGKHGPRLPDGQRPLEVFMMSVVQKRGYQEPFIWMGNYF